MEPSEKQVCFFVISKALKRLLFVEQFYRKVLFFENDFELY